MLVSANDAALVPGLEHGDFFVFLSCTHKSVPKCSLWVPVGITVDNSIQGHTDLSG